MGVCHVGVLTLAASHPGRIKARKRLFAGSHNSLVLYSDVLLGREKEMLDVTETDFVVTPEELASCDGLHDPDAPLWLAIKGRVYDVSAGRSFYGPGQRYHSFLGKDATRSFCTGCLEPACLISALAGVPERQQKEADRWVEYYEHHDRYTFVGRLQTGESICCLPHWFLRGILPFTTLPARPLCPIPLSPQRATWIWMPSWTKRSKSKHSTTSSLRKSRICDSTSFSGWPRQLNGTPGPAGAVFWAHPVCPPQREPIAP